jgi:hypothetical protein
LQTAREKFCNELRPASAVAFAAAHDATRHSTATMNQDPPACLFSQVAATTRRPPTRMRNKRTILVDIIFDIIFDIFDDRGRSRPW